jgi:hypothetical protein
MGNRAAMKASYRFLDNEGVDAQWLMEPHYDRTLERCNSQQYIIVVHDTTNINLSGSPLDVGHIDNGTTNGIMAHSAMAVSAEGLSLGLLYQKVWGRDRTLHGQSNHCSSRPYKDKESYKWEEGVEHCIERLGTSKAIHVCDRESDVYEFLSMKHPANHSLLVRYCHPRSTIHGGKVLDKLLEQPEACRYTVSVVRGENRTPELVELLLRYCVVEIKPPAKNRGEIVRMNVVMAQEVEPSAAKKADKILWILYTDHPVESAQQAKWIVLVYTRRWLIERFHYVLKSGCGVEKLQLRKTFEQIHGGSCICLI